jgi:hypothetical protein
MGSGNDNPFYDAVARATLYVKSSALSAYQSSEAWDVFQTKKTVDQQACGQPTFQLADYILSMSTATAGATIYYTTDGNIPDRFNGTKFDKELPIDLEEGKTVVKAALVDDEGRIGKVYTKKYEISFIKPEDPKINPESGRFTVPSQITILADGNCRLYYTWDGTDPTVESSEYTGPINIPEGNNVLSVVAIDKYGMSSNVVRQNYIYEP